MKVVFMVFGRKSKKNPFKKMIKFKGIELEEGTFGKKIWGSSIECFNLEGKRIYEEGKDGSWTRIEYDENGRETKRIEGDCEMKEREGN